MEANLKVKWLKKKKKILLRQFNWSVYIIFCYVNPEQVYKKTNAQALQIISETLIKIEPIFIGDRKK